MNKLNWLDFDEFISSISKQYKNNYFAGVYGIPRGGLCIAVAISHSLNIPLLNKPNDNCLIVDDIYETGYTLDKFINLHSSKVHVWVSKKKPTWFKAYKYYNNNEWIIFPWENISHAVDDSNLYYQSRK
tara:strand:+ start:93 stop:479 length:387 start_codon:yes stop_codon:yes gene_type:complete